MIVEQKHFEIPTNDIDTSVRMEKQLKVLGLLAILVFYMYFVSNIGGKLFSEYFSIISDN